MKNRINAMVSRISPEKRIIFRGLWMITVLIIPIIIIGIFDTKFTHYLPMFVLFGFLIIISSVVLNSKVGLFQPHTRPKVLLAFRFILLLIVLQLAMYSYLSAIEIEPSQFLILEPHLIYSLECILLLFAFIPGKSSGKQYLMKTVIIIISIVPVFLIVDVVIRKTIQFPIGIHHFVDMTFVGIAVICTVLTLLLLLFYKWHDRFSKIIMVAYVAFSSITLVIMLINHLSGIDLIIPAAITKVTAIFVLALAFRYNPDTSVQNDSLLSQLRIINHIKDKIVSDVALTEERYHSLFHNSLVGMFKSTADGRFLEVNSEMASFFSYESPDEMIRLITNIDKQLYVDVDIRKTFLQQIEKTGAIVDFQSRVCQKNGNVIWISENVRAVYDLKGNIKYFIGAVIDINKQKSQQHYLQMLWQAVESSQSIVVITDPAGTIVFANPAFVTITGYSLKEALGQNPRILQSGHHPLDFYHRLWQTIESGDTWHGEFQNKKKDGSFYWEDAVISTVFDEQHEIINYVAIKQDITEVKQQQCELELKAKLLDAANDIIIVIDLNGRMLSVNHSTIKKLGYSQSQLLDMHIIEILAESSREKGEERIGIVIEQGFMFFESEFLCSSGEILAVEVMAQIFEMDGEQFIFGVHRDISERKQYEKELIRAREAAETANRAKSEFLANMSHEIRTPITAITGMTDLLMTTKMSKKQKEYSEAINISSKILFNLINDILDISKIESGKMKIKTGIFNLHEMVKELHSMFLLETNSKKLKLHIDIASDVPEYLIGDIGRIRQVLVNLLNNAVKFTDCGSVTLNVALEDSIENQYRVSFEVTDTGIGIDGKDAEKLFKMFSQADTSSHKKYRGTGLGLYICKKLADKMNGTISAQSTLGKGSSFYFIITFQKSDYVRASIDNKIESKSVISNPEIFTILVVEDNDINRMLLVHILNSYNYICDTAVTGYEAVLAVKNRRYDIIFMDIQMPKMNGYEATAIIRSNLVTTPIVAITANVFKDDIDQIFSVGMNDYIPKPFKAADVLQKLNTWLLKKDDTPEFNKNKSDGRKLNMNSNDLFDYDCVLKNFMGEKSIVDDVLHVFIDTVSDQLEQIKQSIKTEGYKQIAQEAHSIKGAALNLSANEMGQIAAKLEESVKASVTPEINSLVEELVDSFERTREVIISFFIV